VNKNMILEWLFGYPIGQRAVRALEDKLTNGGREPNDNPR